MKTTRADALGALSLIVMAPHRWDVLRFECLSCRREQMQAGPYPFPASGYRREDLMRQGVKVLRFNYNEDRKRDLFRRIAGKFVVERSTNPLALVMPFDPLFFGGHLLHEIRPEFDNQFYGSVVGVQDVTGFPLQDLKGWWEGKE